MIYWAAVGELDGQSWLEGFSVGDEGVAKVLYVGDDEALRLARSGRPAPEGHGRRAVHRLPHGRSRRQERGVRRLLALERRRRVGREHARGRGAVLAHAGRRRGVQPAVARHHELLEDRVGRERPRRRHDLPGQLGPLGWPDVERLAELAPGLDRSLDERADRVAGRSRHERQRVDELREGERGKELRLSGAQRRLARRRRARRGATTARRSSTSRRTPPKTAAWRRARPTSTPCRTTPAAGGDATPVQGASDPNQSEYYPSYSPDDRYLAFDRAPGSETMYYNPHAEVFVVPAGGGTAAAARTPTCPPRARAP